MYIIYIYTYIHIYIYGIRHYLGLHVITGYLMVKNGMLSLNLKRVMSDIRSNWSSPICDPTLCDTGAVSK